MTTTLFYATLIAFVFLCAIFILLILIQKGRGGGISSAFGGAGGNTAFGSKTGDVLTWATSVVFAIFLGMCVALNYLAADVNAQATGFVDAPGALSPASGIPATPGATPATPDSAPATPANTPATPDATPALPDVEAPNTTATPATPSTQPGQ